MDSNDEVPFGIGHVLERLVAWVRETIGGCQPVTLFSWGGKLFTKDACVVDKHVDPSAEGLLSVLDNEMGIRDGVHRGDSLSPG